MDPFTIITTALPLPVIVIHGGAGAYLKTTTAAQRAARGATMAAIVTEAFTTLTEKGARAGVLTAIAALERDPSFNAGLGAKLQQDGRARLSASLMDGRRSRLSAVYNVQDCLHPSQLANALQERGDRNLDGEGARLLMRELGVPLTDVSTSNNRQRWRELVWQGDTADAEAAIGDAGRDALQAARSAELPMPADLDPLRDKTNRYGTVGAVAVDASGEIWACTSTGGRGHEYIGRVSDSPTPAGNYACPRVALSATGFGEQILDLNLCGRIATRVLDGLSLQDALRRTLNEVVAASGLLGVIAVTSDGVAGYAHTTEACGVSWMGGDGQLHLDQHGASAL
jgi:L-asparaginase